MSIRHRNSENVISVRVPGVERELLCANSDEFVLLRDLSWEDLVALVDQYAEEHDAALTEFFLTPSSDIRKGNRTKASRDLKLINLASPEALCIRVIGKPRGGGVRQVAGKHCTIEALATALTSMHLLQGYIEGTQDYTPAWRIIEEPFEIQREVALRMMSGRIRSMSWTSSHSGLDSLASAQIYELLDRSNSVDEMLTKLSEALLSWLNDPVRKGANGTNWVDLNRPLVLAWFATWLAERGVLLFPLSVVGRGQEFYPPRYRHFLDDWICQTASVNERRAYRAMVVETYAPSGSHGYEDRAWLLLQTFNLVAPGATEGIVSAASINVVKRAAPNLFREQIAVLSGVWRIEMARQRAMGVPAKEIQDQADLVLQWNAAIHGAKEAPIWDWVDNPEAIIPAHSVYSRRALIVSDKLRSNVEELRRVFPIVAGNSASTISSRLSIWLLYLTSIDDAAVPSSLLELKMDLLEPIGSDRKVQSFREFMNARDISPALQSNVYSALRSSWKAVAQESGTPAILCPVTDIMLYSKARKKGQKRPASTTRRSIDMEILELLIEENQLNNFEFSRTRTHISGELLDYRHVVDPQSGTLKRIWWPGIAVLMDLLLQIPIRHKQGRYLDSGEGDEFILDISSLERHANDRPTATPGRNEAFIQRVSLSPIRNEAGLGMFVNTNKTGRDYAFPCLQKEIALRVKSVIDWQMTYNPISEPVSDRADTKEERAANAVTTMVYPIFRDPGRPGGTPVSAEIVLDYFRALMRQVEKKYNLRNNTSLSFFRANGEPVFDIHSLRVTGVTRLLSLGVDPKIVRMLVGHSALVMTWYYENISNERVSAAIHAALERARPSREALLAMPAEDRERFLGRLMGRSEGSNLAISLLRDSVEQRSPLLDIRTDGFCPGMRCSDAGVWRPRACSLCKYFSTGPAFLAGLELRLNGLMAEIILEQKVVAELREKLFRRRAEGGSIATLSAEITTRESLIDNIITEWEAQFQYVKRAEAELQAWLKDDQLSAAPNAPSGELTLFARSPEGVGVALQESHHLVLFTRLIEGAKKIDGFAPAVGTRETRDALLLEIVRHEDKSSLFLRLNREVRREALDQFALFIMDQDLSPDAIEGLCEGTRSLSEVGGAEEWLHRLDSPPRSIEHSQVKEQVP